MSVKDYLFREPEHGRRHILTMISGCVLIALGLLYVGLPQIVHVSLVSIGILNLFLGVAELAPRDRVRLAGTLRATAYVVFLAGLALIAIMMLFASG